MSLLEAKINAVVYDEIYTPRYAVTPIVKYLHKFKTILCPFDTDESEYVKVLKENGFNVIHSHKDDGLNFFHITEEFIKYNEIDCIVSNPPYSIKDDVLTYIYSLNIPFALLLPITALEGKARNRLYQKHGLEILVFDIRINFLKQSKNNYFNTSYFCNGILPEQLVFEKLKRE